MWRRQFAWMLIAGPGGLILLYAAIMLIDPYDIGTFSPTLARSPVTFQARWYKAGIARKPEFDSLILGRSTSMLLQPARLDALFGARFANLGLPGGRPWEQLQMLKLFEREHPRIKVLIVGLDTFWCDPQRAPRSNGEAYRLPQWLYDRWRWNDWLPFSKIVLRDGYRQLSQLLGLRHFPYGNDGYYDFLQVEYGDYDPVAAKQRIHQRDVLATQPGRLSADQLATLPFADLVDLESALAALGTDTLKVLVFVPYHVNQQPPPGSLEYDRLRECKNRVGLMAQRIPAARVLDFMIDSELTRNDGNYWDALHYRTATAERLERLIRDATLGTQAPDAPYRRLDPPGGEATLPTPRG